MHSPYDPAARWSQKRETAWFGYKAHITETCDADRPHLITHILTTSATTHDAQGTESMHRALAQKHLQPAEHLLDRGYVTTQVLIDSAHTHGIEVIGPMKVDTTWQAQSGKGFDIASFTLDWATQRVTCPGGQISQVWADSRDNAGHPRVYVRFAKAACQVCPLRTDCTRSVQGPRTLSFKPKAQYELLQWARQREHTDECKERYARRAGIEGTISQGVRAFGWRRSRYMGQTKTPLQHMLTAVAMHLARFVAWSNGVPRSITRTSAFAALVRQGPRVMCACLQCAWHAYWITWSANTSRCGDIVSPNAFAVWRLMASSNRVGRSTGSVAGVAPFRRRST